MNSRCVARCIRVFCLAFCSIEAAPVVPVNYSGYLVDVYCYGLNQAGAPALDGTHVINDPLQHSVHCMRDVPACIRSGYYLAQRSNATNTYGVRFLLDAATNSRVAEFLSSVTDRDQPGKLTVTAIGSTTGIAAPGSAPILQNALLTACNPPGSPICDGGCVGSACNLFTVSPGNFRGDIAASPKVWGHMICMVLSWGFLLPLGVLWARNTRGDEKKLCGVPIWFQGHRIMQSIGWGVMLLGFVLIVWEKKRHFSAIHEIIGLAVVFIGGLQPLNAQLRHLPCVGHPPEDGTRTPGRLAWEILHKGAGLLAVCLGALNIVLGVLYARNIGYSRVSLVASFLVIPLLALALIGVSCECCRCYRFVMSDDDAEDDVEEDGKESYRFGIPEDDAEEDVEEAAEDMAGKYET